MREVRATVHVRSTPERALEAFLDMTDLRGWWGVERALTVPREGGLYALAWGVSPAGFQYVVTGIVARYQPGEVLRIEKYTYFHPEHPILGPMTLEVRAKGSGGGCEVTVVQDGYQDGGDWDWYYEAVSSAWPVVLSNLRAYLERTGLRA